MRFPENRMKVAEYVDTNSIQHRTDYIWSGNNLLAEMKKYQNGALTLDTRYIRAGFLPVQERDAANAITREYTWGLNLGGGIGGLLNLRQWGNDYSYLYDGKGNVASVIDGMQGVAASYVYDPFGVLIRKSGTFEQPYMFSTKEYDVETGLSNAGYRFYNSSLAKWTTRDPLEEAGGVNLYGFVLNDPVNWVDPLGLYIDQLPPPPKGYDPCKWETGQWDNGRWYLKSPDGRIYTVHPEDDGHWRHWDIQDPSGKDGGSEPPNPGKPRDNQKKLKPNQTASDPSGNQPGWEPPANTMPFVPVDPQTPGPLRLPPLRFPVPAPFYP